MRPTNFCHPNDTAIAHTSCVPGSLRDFHRVDTPRSLGLRVVCQGTECFTGSRNASADLQWTHTALPLESSRLATRSSRAWTFSVHGAHEDRASDTSVANPLLPQKQSVRLRAAFLCHAFSSSEVPCERA